MKNCLILLFFCIRTAFVCAQTPGIKHEFKKPKKSTVTAKPGYRVVENDILKLKKYVHLNGLDKTYFNRYDYLKTPNKRFQYDTSVSKLGDTVSISFGGEYLSYQPEIWADSVIPAIYLTKSFVSNKDWNEYQKYIRDSIARRIYLEEYSDSYGIPTWYYQAGESEPELFDEDERYEWNLNWKKKINYSRDTTNKLFEYIAEMYYPPHERFYRAAQIDQRKMMFRYNFVHNTNDQGEVQYDRRPYKIYVDSSLNYNMYPRWFNGFIYDHWVDEVVSSFSDSTLWKLQNKTPHFDDLNDQLVRYYTWHAQFEDMAVTGINSPQAKGYLAWKQREHQQFLDRKKLPYVVEYSLPTPLEIKNYPLKSQVRTPGFDLSPWRITNKEYEAFILYVRDSIGLFKLAENWDPRKYMTPTYDDDLKETDESEWYLNWKYRRDVISEDQKIREMLEDMMYPKYLRNDKTRLDFDSRKLYYKYFHYNYALAAPLGELVETSYTVNGITGCDEYHQLYCKFDMDAKPYEEIGKDLDLGSDNLLCRNNSVRSHEDRSRFIMYERIAIYPQMKCEVNYYCADEEWDKKGRHDCCTEFFEGKRVPDYDFTSQPDASMTNITYEQAYAYYHWKQTQDGYLVKNDDVLIANYIPSKEEWIKIQKGEKVIHESTTFDMPTPTFRYTMKFYPYNRNGH